MYGLFLHTILSPVTGLAGRCVRKAEEQRRECTETPEFQLKFVVCLFQDHPIQGAEHKESEEDRSERCQCFGGGNRLHGIRKRVTRLSVHTTYFPQIFPEQWKCVARTRRLACRSWLLSWIQCLGHHVVLD